VEKIAFILWLLLLSCSTDKSESLKNDSFSGKLVVQGICMNYVIQVNDADFPQDLIEKKWIYEATQEQYENVFALESVCDFPEGIKEGDSFHFIIDNEKTNECAVCLAYSQVPEKSESITVLQE
jgi:hypothetical protein